MQQIDPRLQEAVKVIATFMSKEKPYLFMLDKMITDFEDGEMTVTFRVYKGFVTDLVTQQMKRHVFKRQAPGTTNSPQGGG